MNIWFTADHHFGHENIIKYCNRPFANADEMDAELIYRHNSLVGANDLVYHLGDFTLRGEGFAWQCLSKMNGQFRLLPGSHDQNWYSDDFGDKQRIIAIPPIFTIEFNQYGSGNFSKPVVLCHYAMRSWDRAHYASWHLFGHSHGKLEPYGLSFDVGVDTHDGYPWSLDEVAEKMATLSPIVDYSKGNQ